MAQGVEGTGNHELSEEVAFEMSVAARGKGHSRQSKSVSNFWKVENPVRGAVAHRVEIHRQFPPLLLTCSL